MVEGIDIRFVVQALIEEYLDNNYTISSAKFVVINKFTSSPD